MGTLATLSCIVNNYDDYVVVMQGATELVTISNTCFSCNFLVLISQIWPYCGPVNNANLDKNDIFFDYQPEK